MSYFSPVTNHVCGGVARRTGHGADVSKAHLGRAGTGRCAAGAALVIRPARTVLGGAGPGRLGDAARDWALTDGRFGQASAKRWGLGVPARRRRTWGTTPAPGLPCSGVWGPRAPPRVPTSPILRPQDSRWVFGNRGVLGDRDLLSFLSPDPGAPSQETTQG